METIKSVLKTMLYVSLLIVMVNSFWGGFVYVPNLMIIIIILYVIYCIVMAIYTKNNNDKYEVIDDED